MSEVIVAIGAGSIGQAIARRVSAGKHVVLADLRIENADAAAEVMRDAGYEVSTTTVDVSLRESVHTLVELATACGEVTSDILDARGEDATAGVLELTNGIGVDAALECVGTTQSMATALGIARPGSTVGVVGAPHGVDVSFEANFWRGVGWQGGVAPARWYIPERLSDVLAGTINPGRVFDYESNLDGIADAYAAMDERRAIKSLVRVGSI